MASGGRAIEVNSYVPSVTEFQRAYGRGIERGRSSTNDTISTVSNVLSLINSGVTLGDNLMSFGAKSRVADSVVAENEAQAELAKSKTETENLMRPLDVGKASAEIENKTADTGYKYSQTRLEDARLPTERARLVNENLQAQYKQQQIVEAGLDITGKKLDYEIKIAGATAAKTKQIAELYKSKHEINNFQTANVDEIKWYEGLNKDTDAFIADFEENGVASLQANAKATESRVNHHIALLMKSDDPLKDEKIKKLAKGIGKDVKAPSDKESKDLLKKSSKELEGSLSINPAVQGVVAQIERTRLEDISGFADPENVSNLQNYAGWRILETNVDEKGVGTTDWQVPGIKEPVTLPQKESTVLRAYQVARARERGAAPSLNNQAAEHTVSTSAGDVKLAPRPDPSSTPAPTPSATPRPTPRTPAGLPERQRSENLNSLRKKYGIKQRPD